MTGPHKSSTFVGTLPPPRVLIIAGSDSGGGAGIQADIKTVTMLGGFAMTAITAITAQNTLGVRDVFPLPLAIVAGQIAAVLDDLGVDAVKIGMLATPELVRKVRDCLEALPAGTPVVLDPVLIATSGDVLSRAGTGEALLELAGLASLVTPNVPELASLTQMAVTDEAGMAAAGQVLAGTFGCPVLAKGGHLPGEELVDLLVTEDGVSHRWSSARIQTRSTHGTGCTLASAVATGLGRRRSMVQAIEQARDFVRTAMLAAPGFGAGHGPMAHYAASSGETNLNQVTLPARDYESSVAFYRALGLTQIVDSPGRYARFECPGGATLSIHVEEGAKAGDTIICLESSDLDAWVGRLRAAGIAFETLPVNQRWGWREARLRDPAGNRLCLYRAGEYRRFPPWRLPAE